MQEAVDAQDCLAYFDFGVLHDYGYGVFENLSIAAKYYELAMAQGSFFDHSTELTLPGIVKAQGNLASLYECGQGVVKNLAKAFELFKDAADKGDAFSEYNLGLFYLNGKSDGETKIEQDTAKALPYLLRAANKLHSGALFKLGIMYSFGQGHAHESDIILTLSQSCPKRCGGGEMVQISSYTEAYWSSAQFRHYTLSSCY